MKKIKLISRIFLILGIMVANNYLSFGVELVITYDMGNNIYLICSNVQTGPGADNDLSDLDDGCYIFVAQDVSSPEPPADFEVFPNWVVTINVPGYTGGTPSGGDPVGDPGPDPGPDLPPDVEPFGCPCCGDTDHLSCECENETYDPYDISYHNNIIKQISDDWHTTKIEEAIQRSLASLTVNFVLGVWQIVDNFIDVLFYDDGSIVDSDYLIEHSINVNYVDSYNWSGKIVALKNFFYKIAEVNEYSTMYEGKRQVGRAIYNQRLIDNATGEVILNLWNGEVGYPGSIADLRCGKPSVGQDLFFNCGPI